MGGGHDEFLNTFPGFVFRGEIFWPEHINLALSNFETKIIWLLDGYIISDNFVNNMKNDGLIHLCTKSAFTCMTV